LFASILSCIKNVELNEILFQRQFARGETVKIAVRYQSRGGNTKAVAEIIAKGAGVTAESIEKPIDEPIDILFVGGGVYYGDIDLPLKTFLENLNPELVKSIAAFTTATAMDRTKVITSIAKKKGINVSQETLGFKTGFRNHGLFGGKGYIKLNEKQIRSVNEFVNEIIGKK
jgi:flavodoxin